MIALIVIGVVVAILIFMVIGTYNGLVSLRNKVKNAFAQIDVQLKRRYDLIPNLVETAKTYMAHEKGVLEAVTKARNQAAHAEQKASANPEDPQAMKGLMDAESGLKRSMGNFYAVMENYPDLKANQNMMQLSEELTSTENKISFARQAFNDAVMQYNTKREVFPNIVFAGALGFQRAESFEITDPTERDAVKVSF
ncbi:MAG: LemA family protein [Leptospira sp.]|nr:LemA family protein [Leptospira sp.]